MREVWWHGSHGFEYNFSTTVQNLLTAVSPHTIHQFIIFQFVLFANDRKAKVQAKAFNLKNKKIKI